LLVSVSYTLSLTPAQTLKYAIRALKLWAKRRGVYKNVLGFLGGIAIEIMAARVAQLYPRALPSKLVYAFFNTYAMWPWPQPVNLTEIRRFIENSRVEDTIRIVRVKVVSWGM
jgi:poly(A) polymerase